MADPQLPACTPDDPPEHLQRLTPMQQAFVTNYVANGGRSKAAATAAGYAPDSAHVTASRMLRNPLIVQAIHAETITRLGHLGPAAVKTMARLSSRAKSEYVQLEASKDILDRLGLSAPKRVDISGGVSVSIDLG